MIRQATLLTLMVPPGLIIAPLLTVLTVMTVLMVLMVLMVPARADRGCLRIRLSESCLIQWH
jgi:hypothetical protein